MIRRASHFLAGQQWVNHMTFLEQLPNALRWSLVYFWWLPLLALGIDLLAADPRRLYHPVQGVGFLARLLEPLARRGGHLILNGWLVLAGLCLAACFMVGLTLWLPWGLGLLAAVYWSWSGLALGGLWRSGKRTLALIEGDDLEAARLAVSHLVTRDVKELDREDLCKTLAESLSENLNDGFTAPFFWLLVGGPVGLWLYKTVSTMDSLWGYKTERWVHLGRAAARTDDFLAFIPARLTAVFLFLSSPIARLPLRWPGWRLVAAQARLMESPNSGWPMAAAAWLHGASMGGKARYHDIQVDKPLLGPVNTPWSVEKARGLIRHVLIAGIFGGVCMWLAALLPAFWIY